MTAPVSYDPAPVLDRREYLHLLDREIAEQLGVTTGTIRNWRSGRRRLTRKRADELAIGLGLHPVLIWPEWGAL